MKKYIKADIASFDDESPDIQHYIAKSTPRAGTLEQLAVSKDDGVRACAAANPVASEELLSQLIKDRNPYVRLNALNNPNMPEEVVESVKRRTGEYRLCFDRDDCTNITVEFEYFDINDNYFDDVEGVIADTVHKYGYNYFGYINNEEVDWEEPSPDAAGIYIIDATASLIPYNGDLKRIEDDIKDGVTALGYRIRGVWTEHNLEAEDY